MTAMLVDHFPLLGLRLTTPRLELRLPSPEELAELADLASLAVSRKLGYQPDGHQRHAIDGALALEHRLCLSRAEWERRRRVPVSIDGLGPCLPLFGIDPSASDRKATAR